MQLSTEYSNATHKLETCHQIVTGFSKQDVDGCEPDKSAAQELRLRVEVIVSKLLDAALWPVGLPEIAQHAALSQRLQDMRDRLEALEDMSKSSTDQDSSLPMDETSLMEHNLIPEENDDTSLLNRLDRLETCVPDVGNEMLRLCDGIIRDVDARIEQKLVPLRIQSSALEEGELRDPDLIPHHVLGNFQGEIDRLAGILSSSAGKKVDLMDRPDNLAAEISKISLENDILRSKNIQVRLDSCANC